MTFSTIQPIGKNPATTPSSDARIDIPAGMVKMKIVIRLVTITRSEEHTSELQSQSNLVCRLLLEKKKKSHIGNSFVRLKMSGPIWAISMLLTPGTDPDLADAPLTHRRLLPCGPVRLCLPALHRDS